jgi:hypothetical protein
MVNKLRIYLKTVRIICWTSFKLQFCISRSLENKIFDLNWDKLGGVRVNANVATVLGSIPASCNTQWGIGTAGKAGLNKLCYN